MAYDDPLSSGLAGCCKTARLGGGLPASEPIEDSSTPRPRLPPDIVRLIDALARRMERKERLQSLVAEHGAADATWMVAKASATQDAKLLVDAGVTVTEWDVQQALGIEAVEGLCSITSLEPTPSIDDKLLRWYAQLGYDDEVEDLLDKGADPRDSFALDMAVYCGHDAVIALLTAAAAAAASAE